MKAIAPWRMLTTIIFLFLIIFGCTTYGKVIQEPRTGFYMTIEIQTAAAGHAWSVSRIHRTLEPASSGCGTRSTPFVPKLVHCSNPSEKSSGSKTRR